MSAENLRCGPLRIEVIGVPGVPDIRTGGVFMAPNIIGVDRIDVPQALGDRLGIEVLMENDVNLAALGEHWMGRERDSDDLVFISIGTGIGAGIVINGKLVRGTFGAAGEVGFLPLGANPFEPESMKVGALERECATDGIIRRYQALSGRTTGVQGVFAAVADGEKSAIAALDSVALQVARVCAAIAAIVDPSLIVIGGSIGARTELLTRIKHFASQCYPREITIEPSQLGVLAAHAGGAFIALSHLHVSSFFDGQRDTDIQVPPPTLEEFRVAVQ